LPKWLAEGHPVTDAPTPPRERHFTARANSFLLREIDQVMSNVTTKREQLVDARASERFRGEVADPWGKSGHVPGSFNLPFNVLLNADGTFKDAAEIRTAFEDAGVDLEKPIVTTCGSGVTACVLAMGAYIAANKQVAVFDGSWAQWATTEDSPVATGPA
ncbi:MAG TPA: 3-mercaptopyruvate sulfurtransferase, partial [Thalassospira sp.]|nr:3-mercaptopyruvate sulfurtransferase [Thalassospira sp.]